MLVTERRRRARAERRADRGRRWTGLLGAHPRIQNAQPCSSRSTSCSRGSSRFSPRCGAALPRASAQLQARASSSASARGCASTSSTPRVLTSFVRNRLIDEVYLPLVGANLAKQLGAVGREEAHRPDGHAAARLAARLRQDDADGVRREPARPRLHEGERPGARPRGDVARSRPRRRTRPRGRRSRRSTSRSRWATT